MNPIKLDGGCYVLNTSDLILQQEGPWHWAPVIGKSFGSEALSQFYVEMHVGTSQPLCFDQGETVLYVIQGDGEIQIAGHSLTLSAESGWYIKTGETFSLTNLSSEPIRLLVSVCPESQWRWLEEMPEASQDLLGNRSISASASERQATGDRFYKLLVNPALGSQHVTQFIGMIPRSKAPKHFHLYEEAIYILSGEGYMWTDENKTAVKPGSLIFLPKTQNHCLECTDDQGMLLVGLFYPAGSPAINYKESQDQS